MRIISCDLTWSSIRYSLGRVVWLVKAQVVVVVVQSFNSHIRGPYFVMIMNLQVVLKAGCWLRDRCSYLSADFLNKSLVKGHYLDIIDDLSSILHFPTRRPPRCSSTWASRLSSTTTTATTATTPSSSSPRRLLMYKSTVVAVLAIAFLVENAWNVALLGSLFILYSANFDQKNFKIRSTPEKPP